MSSGILGGDVAGERAGRRRHDCGLQPGRPRRGGEIILVLAIALIVLGPKRLPDAGRSIGRGIRNFKSAVSGEDDEDEDAKVVEQRKSQKSP